MTKQLESKGRDKGRQKFNHHTNEQLRSIKYKSKQAMNSSSTHKNSNSKNNQLDEEEAEEEEQEEERA